MPMIAIGHMPFAFSHAGRDLMLFCSGQQRQSLYGADPYTYTAWSVCWLDLQDPSRIHRLATGFRPQDIECNPVAFVLPDGSLKVSFVASRIEPNRPTSYWLYTMHGRSLDALGSAWGLPCPSQGIFNGFGDGRTSCFCRKSDVIWQDHTAEASRSASSGMDEYLRVAPYGDKSIIVTGRRGAVYGSEIWWSNGDIAGVTQAGRLVYKCSILEDQVFHAVRGDEFEAREIHSGPLDQYRKSARVEWIQEPYSVANPPLTPAAATAATVPAPASRIATPCGARSASAFAQAVDGIQSLTDDSDRTQFLRSMLAQNLALMSEKRGSGCSRWKRKIVDYWQRYGESSEA